jgi:tetratricopeptide (TPR) repeat protein
MVSPVSLDVYVRGPDGAPIEGIPVVTLIAFQGGVYQQASAMAGHAEFHSVPQNRYSVQVEAPGYEKNVTEVDVESMGMTRVIVDMQPEARKVQPAAPSLSMILAPKAQKELSMALEALKANKPEEARSHLDVAYRLAPNHPDVNFLFGVYFLQMNDREKAKSYWTKTLEFDPKHLHALLCLSDALVRQRNLPDAELYVKRAVEAAPTSWRAHAILAEVFYYRRFLDETIKEAERALELGHAKAEVVEPLLASALARGGNKDRATKILKEYVQNHPTDAAAKRQLERLQSPGKQNSPSEEVSIAETQLSAADAALSLSLPSSWLPPDVDEAVPPVEAGTACKLDEVVQKAGKRVQEFVQSVDQFRAKEFLKHKSINKLGIEEPQETRKYDYVAVIEHTGPGSLNVREYRGNGDSPPEFLGGVETFGLAVLALVFHPYNAGNFEMSCEGLNRWNGNPTWQVHFRQRADKPNIIREYEKGEDEPGLPVALKGRAWIAADSYQVLRMETDLVAKVPEIQLIADHMVVEYGPVPVPNRDAQMWLPQSAEVYYDWKGQRMHRRHSFSNYLLLSEDEK